MIIALTGGAGAGKSTVAALFTTFGIPMINADALGHACLAPHQPGYHAVLKHFGTSLQLPDKTLDRKQLRRLIFQSPDERQWLEHLLHPLIKQALLEQCARTKPNPYLLIEIPLLFESASDFKTIPHRTVVVQCRRALQRQRLHARDQSDEATLEALLDAQLDDPTRAALADDHIDNNGLLADLHSQVQRLHQYYVQLCRAL